MASFVIMFPNNQHYCKQNQRQGRQEDKYINEVGHKYQELKFNSIRVSRTRFSTGWGFLIRFLSRRRYHIIRDGIGRRGLRRKVEVDINLAVDFEANAAVAGLVVTQQLDQAQGLLVAGWAQSFHDGRVLHKAVVVDLVFDRDGAFDALFHRILGVLDMGTEELAQGLGAARILRFLQKLLVLFLLFLFHKRLFSVHLGLELDFVDNETFDSHRVIFDLGVESNAGHPPPVDDIWPSAIQ